jgi:hypothetical protein
MSALRPGHFRDARDLLCQHLPECTYVRFRGPEKVCRNASLGGELEVMSRKVLYVDHCSATAKMEQALSVNHPQQEPAVARNSWRELLEIVDAYLTRNGVNG